MMADMTEARCFPPNLDQFWDDKIPADISPTGITFKFKNCLACSVRIA